MFEVTYQQGELAVRAAGPLIPAVVGFLKKLGFRADGPRRMAAKSSKPHDVIVSVRDMIGMYGPCNLDSGCRSILEDAANARLRFQEAVGEAAAFKSLGRQHWEGMDITVPKMDPTASLKWYQKMPVMHAVTLGNSANFSVSGSGKTWMGYSAFLKLKYETREIDKLLIVAPLVAFRPWETEYAAMTGERSKKIRRIVGAPPDRKRIFERDVPKFDMFLISHAMASKEEEPLAQMMCGARFMVIVDESHNIKRQDGQRATALRRIAPHAAKRMILTGTPMPKSLNDLWSQFAFLYPGNALLPPWPQYEQRCKAPDAHMHISSTVGPHFVRVSKEMLDLPEPAFNPRNAGAPTVVPMDPIQRRIYDAIALKVRDNAEQFRSDAVALERFRKNAMIYLIEAATDPALLTKDTTYQNDDIDAEGLGILEMLEKYPRLRGENLNKLEAAKRMAQETLGAGGKVIIWCSFVNTIKKMSAYMEEAGHETVTVWGEVPRDPDVDPEFNREAEIEKFKAVGRHNVMIANPSSLAESISLHRHCHHAIYVDRTFNGAHYMQSLDRIHRVGLDPGVQTQYDILQSERSIDQTIHDRLITKQKNMERFLNLDTIEVYAAGDDEDQAGGFDGSYEEDFNAVIGDIKEHVGNV